MITDANICREWVVKNYNKAGNEIVSAIGFEKDNEITAVTGYSYFNGKSCHIHFYLKGYVNKNYVWFVHYYPFIQCGLATLVAIMAASNTKILRLSRKLGYKEQYRLKDAHPDGDLVISTLLKQDCRFI